MAGLALLSSAVASRAGEMSGDGERHVALEEEVSMASGHLRSATGMGGLRPRRPLSSEDAALIRTIIGLQNRRSFSETDGLLGELHSDLLNGTILAQRLRLAPGADRAALVTWMARYGGEADAPEIARLLAAVDQGAVRRPEPPSDVAVLRPDQVRSLFAANRDGDAMRAAMSRGRCRGPGCFAAGLAAWRSGRFGDAATFFKWAADDPDADPGTQAAGLFWLARTQLRKGHDAAALAQLGRAAVISGSFYGILSARLLADGGVAVRPGSVLNDEDLDSIEALPAGARALALLQVGEPDLALAALRHLLTDPTPGVRPGRAVLRSVAVFAHEIDRTRTRRPTRLDVATLATVRLPAAPHGGYAIDPALLYAIIRVESNFQPDVVSHRGARGLMQIMPITATYLLDGPGAKPRPIRFDDPATNLELGQRYVGYLVRHEAIQGDLVRMLASYNMGGGAFARLDKTIRADGDPLMFIEAIPKNETRSFVQRVLAFSWLYASALEREHASLDALALGEFPRVEADSRLH